MNRLPCWFLQDIPNQAVLERIEAVGNAGVHTVCRQAHCPNTVRCLNNNQLTFLILGNVCTRNCRFCAVEKSTAAALQVDPQEPGRIATLVKLWGLRYVVVTSVTRDDLDDGGANQFTSVVKAVKSISQGCKIEVLVPDFQGKIDCIEKIVHTKPEVFGHNIETVRRLYQVVRHEADYNRSLDVLKAVKSCDPYILTKSSIMLGLGENEYDILEAMEDLRSTSVDILTLGQYLAPSSDHYPVQEFISEEQFTKYGKIAKQLGFRAVLAGPLVRSSYCAEELYNSISC